MQRHNTVPSAAIPNDGSDADEVTLSTQGNASARPKRMHTLVLTGELDSASTHTLVREIAHLCRGGATGITLDLANLNYIDPTGVAAVLFMGRWCQKRGYDFALIPGSWLIQRSFELAGLIDRLPFKDTTPMPLGPERTRSSERERS
jgi:anti-anti-sigma factor